LALACLQSIPVDVDRDIAQIDYLVPYLQVQSTLGYLKQPPAGYLIQGVDVIGGMKQIRQKLTTGGYSSQYDWALDVWRIFVQASDGHFYYTPSLLNIFIFRPEMGTIVSASSNGVDLPKVYFESDLLTLSADSSHNFSDIVSIDNTPIIEYLEQVGAMSFTQDPDAQYNTVFSNVAFRATKSGDAFSIGGPLALPDQSVARFSNGTTFTFDNRAFVQESLADITTGADLHVAFEITPPSARLNSTPSSSTTPTTTLGTNTITNSTTPGPTPLPAVNGYPYPVVKHANNYAAGYFLNDTGYQDIAVLSLLSFEADEKDPNYVPDVDDVVEFRRVIRTFIDECKEAGKKRLVIDVSANGGGLVFEAFELYRTLFPSSYPYDGSRFRASDAYNFIGQSLYGTDAAEELFNDNLNRNHRDFPTWKSLFGPVEFPQDNVTNLLRYNFSAPDLTSLIVSGFNASDTPPAQLFTADDIVIVTDGVCGSTCTIFTGLMTRQEGVKTIALGGRPLEAPMQAIGGVKGSQYVAPATSHDVLGNEMSPRLTKTINRVENFATLQKKIKQAAAAKNLTRAPDGLPSLDDSPLLPLVATSGSSYNIRNAYASDSQDTIPLQFVYEAANCRRFYTFQTLYNVTALWVSVADVAWNGLRCVSGSTTSADNKIGRGTPAYTDKVRSAVPPYTGPGSPGYKVNTTVGGSGRYVTGSRKSASSGNPYSHLREDLLYRQPTTPVRLNWWSQFRTD